MHKNEEWCEAEWALSYIKEGSVPKYTVGHRFFLDIKASTCPATRHSSFPFTAGRVPPPLHEGRAALPFVLWTPRTKSLFSSTFHTPGKR